MYLWVFNKSKKQQMKIMFYYVIHLNEHMVSDSCVVSDHSVVSDISVDFYLGHL